MTIPLIVQAVKHGAVYPHKMWFIYGLEGGEWWEWDGVKTNTNCSKEDMKRFLHKAITVVPNFDGEMQRRQPNGEEVCSYVDSSVCACMVCKCAHKCVQNVSLAMATTHLISISLKSPGLAR